MGDRRGRGLVDHSPGPEAVEPEGSRDGMRRVARERRPAVLADGFEPVVKLDRRGAEIGRAALGPPDLHERVGLLGAGRKDPARAVIFEGAADEVDAVGQERRGERVARMAREPLAVERKGQGAAAVDAPAGGEPEGLRYGAAPSAAGRGSPIR